MLKKNCVKNSALKLQIGGVLSALILSTSIANASGGVSYDKNHDHSDKKALVQTKLATVLDSQPDDVKARYPFRNPAQTLGFFKIKPGMKVVEILPGGGWYSKLLLPLLGKDGELVGADYALDMWPHFSFMTPERLEKKKTWVSSWTKDAESWGDENSAKVSAFQLSNMPKSVEGSADAVLFIRALHNLARHHEKGPYLDSALKETYLALKPGGLVGIVQHQAHEDRPDEWADGNKGYLKKSFVIKKMEAHGFELIGESDVNSNHKDQASVGDSVWRLPPSLRGHKEDVVSKQRAIETGESNRMTLLFKKPK